MVSVNASDPYCSRCGTVFVPLANFCSHCGLFRWGSDAANRLWQPVTPIVDISNQQISVPLTATQTSITAPANVECQRCKEAEEEKRRQKGEATRMSDEDLQARILAMDERRKQDEKEGHPWDEARQAELREFVTKFEEHKKWREEWKRQKEEDKKMKAEEAKKADKAASAQRRSERFLHFFRLVSDVYYPWSERWDELEDIYRQEAATASADSNTDLWNHKWQIHDTVLEHHDRGRQLYQKDAIAIIRTVAAEEAAPALAKRLAEVEKEALLSIRRLIREYGQIRAMQREAAAFEKHLQQLFPPGRG